ncbi:hypothetical protein O3P69_020918, partial [Scylla paramamosain]
RFGCGVRLSVTDVGWGRGGGVEWMGWGGGRLVVGSCLLFVLRGESLGVAAQESFLPHGRRVLVCPTREGRLLWACPGLEPHKSVVSVGSSGAHPGPGGRSPAHSAAEQRDDVNGVLDNSPIYVTSVPSLTSEQPRPSPRKEAPTLKAAEGPSGERSSRRSSRRRSARLTNSHHGAAEAEAEANKSGDELELKQYLDDTLDDTEDLDQDEPPDTQCDRTEVTTSGDSLPGTPEKAYGITRSESRRSSSRGSRRERASPREVLLDKEPLPPPPPDARPKTPVHAVSSVESRESTR